MRIIEKFNIYFYEILLVSIMVAYYVGILYTNSYLTGADISDFVDLNPNTLQTATFKSARLPVYYFFELLYKGLNLPNDLIKALIALFCSTAIIFSIYSITINVFKNKLSGILAVILFLFSSLYFSVSFSILHYTDNSSPDTLSYTLLMLGIMYWLKEKYIAASIFMGLSFGCHPILPIGLIIAFFLHQLIKYKIIGVKSILTTLLLFLVISLPVTYSVIQVAIGTIRDSVTQVLDKELIFNYIRFVQPQTIFFNAHTAFKYGLSLYFSSFLLLLFLYARSDEKKVQEKYLKLFLLIL